MTADLGLPAQPFVATVAVRFRDVDMFGHVNHAEYLAFCEEHRTAFFQLWEHESGIQPLDAGFVVAKVSADFLTPLSRHVRSVQVQMSVVKVGRTSMTLRYRINCEEVASAVVDYTLVLVDGDQRPRPISPDERTVLARFAEH
jgi:acyl-CoA thioester hydrolase